MILSRLRALLARPRRARVPAPAHHDEWRADFRARRERVESLERAMPPRTPPPSRPSPVRAHSPNLIIDRLIIPRPNDERRGGR